MNENEKIGIIFGLTVLGITLFMESVSYFSKISRINPTIIGLIYLNLAMFVVITVVRLVKKAHLIS